ncbi:uncharacterized protein LOC135208298 [Macrobrachium nipponense]|uniref:uncharacterized protein LOC135208298 n=1 Tax=Macrobrachium nipponense TaxID=159736 RepID=UPI0030C837F0
MCGRCRPLPPSDGARYLLTVIDWSTRWPEATLMSEATADACAKALLSSWISRLGMPDDIMTNQGTAFTSELWIALARLMGMKHHTTMAYNPAANGMVERTHHSFKASLMAHCMGPDWKALLSWVLLGLCTAPRTNSDPWTKTFPQKAPAGPCLGTKPRRSPAAPPDVAKVAQGQQSNPSGPPPGAASCCSTCQKTRRPRTSPNRWRHSTADSSSPQQDTADHQPTIITQSLSWGSG